MPPPLGGGLASPPATLSERALLPAHPLVSSIFIKRCRPSWNGRFVLSCHHNCETMRACCRRVCRCAAKPYPMRRVVWHAALCLANFPNRLACRWMLNSPPSCTLFTCHAFLPFTAFFPYSNPPFIHPHHRVRTLRMRRPRPLTSPADSAARSCSRRSSTPTRFCSAPGAACKAGERRGGQAVGGGPAGQQLPTAQ